MKRIDLWFQSELPINIDTSLSWYQALCQLGAKLNELVDAYNKIDVENIYTADNPPPYPVLSVNGKTGAVQLTIADIPDAVSDEELGALRTELQTYVGTQIKPLSDKQTQLENQQTATAANVVKVMGDIAHLQATTKMMSATTWDAEHAAQVNTWYNEGTRIVFVYKADSYTDETYIADIYALDKLGQSETASAYQLNASQVLIVEQNVFDQYGTDAKKALYSNHVRLLVVKDPNGGQVLYALTVDGETLPIGGSGGEGGAVLSVNGKVGNVVITAASIGAALDTELQSAEHRIESLEDWQSTNADNVSMIGDINNTVSQHTTQIESLVEKANDAQQNASDALSAANTASGKADAAQTAAETAGTKADAAQTAATEASGKAEAAQSAAEAADAKATEAQGAAQSAAQAAQAAQTAADEAVKSVYGVAPNEAGDTSPQFGGTNILLKTRSFGREYWKPVSANEDGKFNGLTVYTSNVAFGGMRMIDPLNVKAGETYSFTCFIKGTWENDLELNNADFNIDFGENDTTDNFKPRGILIGNQIKNGEFVEVRGTTHIVNDTQLTVRAYANVGAFDNGLKSFSVCGYCLVRGVVPRDWTPAPEDLENQPLPSNALTFADAPTENPTQTEIKKNDGDTVIRTFSTDQYQTIGIEVHKNNSAQDYGFKYMSLQYRKSVGAFLGYADPPEQSHYFYTSRYQPPYPVRSVNSQTGEVNLTAANVGAVPTTRKVNGKELSEDVTLTAADVGAPTSTAFEETAKQALDAYSPSNPPPAQIARSVFNEQKWNGEDESVTITTAIKAENIVGGLFRKTGTTMWLNSAKYPVQYSQGSGNLTIFFSPPNEWSPWPDATMDIVLFYLP